MTNWKLTIVRLGGRYVIADHIFVYDAVQLSVLQVVRVASAAVIQPGNKRDHQSIKLGSIRLTLITAICAQRLAHGALNKRKRDEMSENILRYYYLSSMEQFISRFVR